MKDFRILNSRAPRIDAFDKVTGKAIFVDDIKRPNMLYGAILHSPLAHAKILNIDTSTAEKLPGVKKVVTSKEAGNVRWGVSPARYDENIFCIDKVKYVGDEIAAVAAVDLETAREAVELIKVDYEELPIVLDGLKAMDEGKPQIHPKYPRNTSAEVHWHFGDIEKGRAESDYIRTDSLSSKMQDAAFMEPQSMIAEYDQNGYLTLTSSTQAPHYVQRTLAMALKIPLHKVRVIKPYVGGGFGPKAACSTAELATCLLAIQTGKPVKLIFEREQVFLHSRARHQFFHKMTTGVKKDGTLMFLDHEAILDGGAYTSFGIATVYYAASLLGGPYRLKNMKYDGYRVITNKPACGAQRGHGAVIARACFEMQLDRIARELKLDPIELRLKNVMSTGEVTCNELNMSSLGMRECLEAVRDKSGWQDKRKRSEKGKGIGASCGFFVSGAGYPIYRSTTFHCTIVTKLNDVGGTVTVYSGSAEIGQGSDTMLAMITAEVLGIPLDAVHVLSGDTELTVDLGAYSSRTTLMTGNAAKEAAEDLKRKILEVIADKMDVSIDSLDFKDGLLYVDGGVGDIGELRREYRKEHLGFKDLPSETHLTFLEASRLAFLEKGSLVGTGKYKPPPLGGSFKGATVGTSPAFGCSAQIAEVQVDRETGNITVNKVTGAHDCGFAINRTQVEGQMQGSISMGLGEALMEEIKYDSCGRIVNANLAEYKIPTSLDMPELDAIIVESNEPNGPFGAKEVGEGAIMPTIPAIINAVYDATDLEVDELPLTPERIRSYIKKQKNNS